MGVNLLKTNAEDPTDAVFGEDIEGNIFKHPLSQGPHWVVAGQSGGGKSAYVNNLLISMMHHAHPDELHITLIDPKKVEFGRYKGAPHVIVDPITDMDDAYAMLLYLVEVMEDRYARLEDIGVTNIANYNVWVENKEENIKAFVEKNKKDHERDNAVELLEQDFIDSLYELERMPYLVCVIDEYADMVAQDPDGENEQLIVRLAQKARAAGVTLIISTQRPSADIISPTIKSNVPARIAMRTADATNSAIILDDSGAENLLGKGDSYVKLPAGNDLTRVQGLYIPDEIMDAILDHLKEKYPPPTRVDFKKFLIDRVAADGELNGGTQVEWAEEYEDDVPTHKRKIQKKSKMGGFF